MNLSMKRLRRQVQRWRYEGPALLSYYTLRPRVAGVNTDVVRETWDAVADDAHNSNTDLTFWDG